MHQNVRWRIKAAANCCKTRRSLRMQPPSDGSTHEVGVRPCLIGTLIVTLVSQVSWAQPHKLKAMKRLYHSFSFVSISGSARENVMLQLIEYDVPPPNSPVSRSWQNRRQSSVRRVLPQKSRPPLAHGGSGGGDGPAYCQSQNDHRGVISIYENHSITFSCPH